MRRNSLSIRPVVKIKGRLSKDEILKFTEGRPLDRLSQHEIGGVGERITKDVIIPKVRGVSRVQRLDDLKGVSGVPFDVVATYCEEVWLIETKTGRSSFESVQAIQKKRMKRILELLAQRGTAARPILVQIRLETGDYMLRDFPIKYKEKGLAPTFKKIVQSIVDYQRIRS